MSNVVYLWKRYEKIPPRDCFASPREIMELLKAFSRIESQVFRRMIIQLAREAGSCSRPSEPPKNSA
jgi:hypothetical protein